MPTKTLLRPGEALAAARRVPGAREAVAASSTSPRRSPSATGSPPAGTTGARCAGSMSEGIELIRGTGRIAGPGLVAVDGRFFATDHIVLATGSSPIIPPVPRTARPARALDQPRDRPSMPEIPRRPDRPRRGSRGRRDGAGRGPLRWCVTLVEGAPTVLSREPAALGRRARRGAGGRRRRPSASASTPPRHDADGDVRPRASPADESCAATGFWWPPGGAPRTGAIGPGEHRGRARRRGGAGGRTHACHGRRLGRR